MGSCCPGLCDVSYKQLRGKERVAGTRPARQEPAGVGTPDPENQAGPSPFLSTDHLGAVTEHPEVRERGPHAETRRSPRCSLARGLFASAQTCTLGSERKTGLPVKATGLLKTNFAQHFFFSSGKGQLKIYSEENEDIFLE